MAACMARPASWRCWLSSLPNARAAAQEELAGLVAARQCGRERERRCAYGHRLTRSTRRRLPPRCQAIAHPVGERPADCTHHHQADEGQDPDYDRHDETSEDEERDERGEKKRRKREGEQARDEELTTGLTKPQDSSSTTARSAAQPPAHTP